MNLAASRLNDAMKTPSAAVSGQVGGEVTGPQQIYSQEIVNGAWRRMQEFLATYRDESGKVASFSPLVETVVLSSAAAVTNTDPGISCYISYDGYFDGTTLQSSPKLPANLLTPLRLKERVHAVTPNQFTEMAYIINGLTGLAKTTRNFNWGWDNDSIILPGSTSIMDFELRFIKLLDDFEDSGSPTTNWYDQLVPIPRCSEAFSWYIVAEYCSSRGDKDAVDMFAKAEAAATRMILRESANEILRGEWVVPDIPAATGATHYDPVSNALNVARNRLNSVNKAAADIINVLAPWTQQYTNHAFRRLQDYLSDKGTVRLKDEVLIEGLTPDVNPDPAVQTYIDWTGYYNGTTLDTSLVLPENLIMPFKVYQRQTNVNQYFVEMAQVLNGLPSIWTQQPFPLCWEWRADKLYMLGTTAPFDLRIRYYKYLPDFVANSPTASTPWYMQPVPIVRSTDALSLYICVEVAQARPDLGLDASAFQTMAEEAADKIYNRDVGRTQQTTTTRKSLSGRLEQWGGMANGWGGYGY